MRYVEKNLPLLLFLNKNNRINMGKRNSNLFKALKFYLFYVLVVLITTPLVVYLISFFVEKYFFERNVSFNLILNNGILDDIILILGNLFIILMLVKKRAVIINKFCRRTAKVSFDKELLLSILILELSSILPINLLVDCLNFNDFTSSTSDSGLSVAAVVGTCLLAPFAEEMVMRGGVEEYLLRWKPNAFLAILISSLLFGALHLYPSLISAAFLNGLLYGWVYYWSRNVVVCFLMHMVNNVASCLADWLKPDIGTVFDIFFQTRVIIITMFCVVFMVASIVTIKKKTLQKA